MGSYIAHVDFLKGLLQLMVKDLLPDDLQERLMMKVRDREPYNADYYQQLHRAAVKSLIEDLSGCITIPETAVKRFKQESSDVQLCFYDRYALAIDSLDLSKGAVFPVPKEVDLQFKWILTNFWPLYE
jgi:hypothetical protein